MLESDVLANPTSINVLGDLEVLVFGPIILSTIV